MTKPGYIRTLAIALVAGLPAQHALAASECEQNYQTETNAGGTLHLVHVGLAGADAERVLPAMKSEAARNGFDLIGDVPDADVHSIIYGQKPTKTSRGFPLAFMTSARTQSAIVAMELPKEMNAPGAGKQLCGFLANAGLKGGARGADKATKDRNLAYANEIFSAMNGDSGPRKARAEREARVVAAQSPRQASNANDRGAAPEVPDTRRVLKPSAPFDTAGLDKSRLDEGHSTLKGVTCGSVAVVGGAQFQPAANQKILLLPYTAYLQQAVTLMEHKDVLRGKARIELDPRAFSNYIEGMTNEKGWFQFNRVKPGRYLITTTFDGSAVSFMHVPQSQYDGSTNTIYTWTEHRQYNTEAHNMLQADVTVKRDGEIIDGIVAKSRHGVTIPLTGFRVPVLSFACRMHAK